MIDEQKLPQLAFSQRLRHAWNAFKNKDPGSPESYLGDYMDYNLGPGSTRRPDRRFSLIGPEGTIASSIFTTMANDALACQLRHVRVNENGNYIETIDSGLNRIFQNEANTDQTSREFFRDLILSLFDEGTIAAVPIETTLNPKVTGSYDILSMRVAKIVQWYPQHVRVNVYNELTGRHEELKLEKKFVAIIENPFYSVMNETNSTLKRLIHKLKLLDVIDEQSASKKLDLIIQLPYVIKSKARQEQAEARRQQIVDQLANSEYGIAYTDGTERITQLNRSVENNLMVQIEYLTSMLYSQLGLTQDIMNGTASESAMLNYYNRTINVILDAIVDEFERKFLTRTARSQGQAIQYFRNPFALTTSENLAELADKLTRNEVVSPNEIRGVMGYKPVSDERADELRNRNLNASDERIADPVVVDQDSK